MPVLPILGDLSRDWWTLALRGLAAVIFGVLAFFWPGLTLAVLIWLWGLFVLVDGVMAVIAGGRGHWWALLLFGLLAIAAGLIALFQPGLTALALLFVIAAWALVRGVLEIVAAVRLRRELNNEWLLVASGLLSVLLGVLLVMFPAAGVLSLVWLIGAYAIVVGILMLALAFRLRGVQRRLEPGLAT